MSNDCSFHVTDDMKREKNDPAAIALALMVADSVYNQLSGGGKGCALPINGAPDQSQSSDKGLIQVGLDAAGGVTPIADQDQWLNNPNLHDGKFRLPPGEEPPPFIVKRLRKGLIIPVQTEDSYGIHFVDLHDPSIRPET